MPSVSDEFCSLLDIEFYPYIVVAPFTLLAGLAFAFSAFVFYRLRSESDSVTGFLTIIVTEMLVCLCSGACLCLKLVNTAESKAACSMGTLRQLENASVLLLNGTVNASASVRGLPPGKYFPIPLLIAFYATNYLLFARNYCIVVKTGLTLITIAWPIRSRVTLTTARARAAFGACYAFAIVPNCVRFSAEAFSVYVHTDLLPHYIQLLTRNHDTIHAIIFALQGPVPAGVALAISLVISWRLLRRRSPNRHAAAPGIGSRAPSTRAIIRVMLVALIFAQCEIPTTVLAAMDSGEDSPKVVASRVVGNLFVIADSYCNLVVIALTNRKFLRKASELVNGKPYRLRQVNGFSPSNLPLPARESIFRPV